MDRGGVFGSWESDRPDQSGFLYVGLCALYAQPGSLSLSLCPWQLWELGSHVLLFLLPLFLPFLLAVGLLLVLVLLLAPLLVVA